MASRVEPVTLTVREWRSRARAELAAAGRGDADHDAARIVAASLGVAGESLSALAEEPVPGETGVRIAERVARRAAGEPLDYVLGVTRFRGLELAVDPSVYIPKSDILVDVALEAPAGARVHDVGTGCGAIALAVKHARRDLVVTGSDISPEAVEAARANAVRLGLDVRFFVADGVPDGDYDLAVAVLPYLLAEDPMATQVMGAEPRVAVIVPGDDPVEIIRHVISTARRGQLLALQHARADAETVRALLDDPITRGPEEGPWTTLGRGR